MMRILEHKMKTASEIAYEERAPLAFVVAGYLFSYFIASIGACCSH